MNIETNPWKRIGALLQAQFSGARLLLPISACLSLAFAGYFLSGLSAQDFFGGRAITDANNALGNRIKASAVLEGHATVSDVVTKALAFKAMLTTAQQQVLEQTYTSTLARRWSNLPCASTCRNGIGLGTLTSDQLAAALAVIQAVEGTLTDEGYDEFQQIRMADDVLAAAQGSGGGGPGGGGYGSGLYYLAFLNTPTATGAWMIQFGGHHYGANIGFNQGHVISTTPLFYGLEPLTFTSGGSTHAPLSQEHDALANMLASLTSDQLAAAKLTQTFSDVTLSPGESNGGSGTFPATKVGLAVSSLSASQKQLVLNAMKPWVQDMDATVAANLLAIYQGELDGTYIAFTGNGVAGSASSFLVSNTNYARIDGPSVWIEFACQNGVVFPTQIHYHTIWRDHLRDYGKDLTLTTPLDSTSTTVGAVSLTSAASYASGSLAPEAIGALFGSGLASSTVSATTTTLPTTLGNVQVQVTDSAGVARNAPLFFVSPTQINFQTPTGTASGTANVAVLLNGSSVGQGTATIASVNPGLFAANANAQGVAAAVALRVKADGTQSFEPVLQLNTTTNLYEPAALSIGAATDQLFLIAFGTGFRNRTALSNVSATIGSTAAEVTYAGAQATYVGLDQANIRIPSTLAGSGQINVVLTVDGKSSNPVVINVQ